MIDVINWNSFFFLLAAATACSFAVAVVLSSNIVHMACYLVVSLAAVAGLFFLAGADFLGAAQLMVYVGGTMVLLIFGVMLTSRGPFVSMKTGGGQWILALVIAGALLAILIQAAVSIPTWAGPRKSTEPDMELAAALRRDDPKPATVTPRYAIDIAKTASDSRQSAEPVPTPAGQLGLGLMGIRTDRLTQANPEQRAGMIGYLLPFEIVSIHLVVALIGAAYLARPRRQLTPKPTNMSEEETSRAIDYLLKKMP